MSSDQVVSEAANIMVRLLRLSQISSNPCLIHAEYEGSNAKLSELDDILDDVFADDTKKVILWSHYVQNVHRLVERYQDKFKSVSHTGEMSVEDRQLSVKAFQDDPETKLFIATPQSAKEGLTLLPRDGKMKADTMIYMDLSFDSGSYVQSQARFHRIGQTAERCLVLHLVGEATVDEYIRRTVIEKIKTATELLDDGLNSNASFFQTGSGFSKDDLLRML
jgi:SNF2 family DNA or RNA helicase